MKKHIWNKESKHLKNSFTEQHQCDRCGLYRYKALGKWFYSNEIITDKNPFVLTIPNQSCIAE